MGYRIVTFQTTSNGDVISTVPAALHWCEFWNMITAAGSDRYAMLFDKAAAPVLNDNPIWGGANNPFQNANERNYYRYVWPEKYPLVTTVGLAWGASSTPANYTGLSCMVATFGVTD